MNQEDINELMDKHPSDEAISSYIERLEQAIIRDCACVDSAAAWDTDCYYDNHTHPRKQ